MNTTYLILPAVFIITTLLALALLPGDDREGDE